MRVAELIASGKYPQSAGEMMMVRVTRDGRRHIYPAPCPAKLVRIDEALLLDVLGVDGVTTDQLDDLSGWDVFHRGGRACGTWVIATWGTEYAAVLPAWRVDGESKNLDIVLDDTLLGVEHD